jgi:hypothetical protein
MNITTGSVAGRDNVIWDYIHEDIPGGVSLTKTRIPSTLEYVKAGSPVNVVKSTRKAELIKTAVTVADSADGDNIRVAKGHLFAAADVLTDGYVVAAITSITTTEAAYDTLVMATTLVNYAEGTVLVESATGKSLTNGATVSILMATGKTITLNDPSGKSAGLKVDVKSAADDNLAVAFSGKTLTIQMANATGTKNTPAVEVQAAVRALVASQFDFSQFVLSGDEETTITGTKTGTMAVSSPYLYEANGLVKDTVNVEGANAQISVVVKGAAREGSLPYPVSAGMKATMPGITFNV